MTIDIEKRAEAILDDYIEAHAAQPMGESAERWLASRPPVAMARRIAELEAERDELRAVVERSGWWMRGLLYKAPEEWSGYIQAMTQGMLPRIDAAAEAAAKGGG